MRARIAWLIALLVLVAGGITALSLSRGQDQPPSNAPAVSGTLSGNTAAQPEPKAPERDLTRLTPLQRQMYLSARRGADWLVRTNRPDGQFDHGYQPALGTVLEGDHYLRQAGAAFALARAAALTGDERYSAIARQAILRLLLSTTTDSQNPTVRHTSLPSVVVNRLGAAGMLVMAINELPSPGADLLDQSDQLCAYIRQQQQPDGSLCFTDSPGDVSLTGADPEGLDSYPGEALYGLMLSQRYRPAGWKTDTVRKALGYYRSWWQAHRSMAFTPWQTAAYAEAYLLTREKAFADFVDEMNDWICGLQYNQLDQNHPLWLGGFMGWSDGKPAQTVPLATSADYAEGLAEACRVARQAGDVARFQRYREALERSLQFVATLQYTETNTRQFADWYRPVLLGGFCAAHHDGTLRIDYTQHAVSALAQYLRHVADVH
jgi:hypothetical protein